METSLQLLRRIALFHDLETTALEQLAAHSRRRRFGAGEFLFHQDDSGHTIYVIATGYVNIQTLTDNGDVIHIATRGPGDHFGEMSLIDGKPRMADAVTAQPCELLMLDRTDFLRCIESHPRIAFSVMASLADRLREAALHLQNHKELDVLGRVAQLLLQLMQTHGVAETGGGTRITVRLSQQELADRVGATRESVNRALSLLKESRALRTEGRSLIVINPKKLRQCCEV